MVYAGQAERLDLILNHHGNEENLFYTVAHIKESAFPIRIGVPWKPHIYDFEPTESLAIDIDGVPPEQYMQVCVRRCDRIVEEVGGTTGDRYYVASGHGLHMIIGIPEQTSIEFFRVHHDRYRHACLLLQTVMTRVNITCKQVDPSIFEASRLLRVPGTVNLKEGKEPAPCRWIESRE